MVVNWARDKYFEHTYEGFVNEHNEAFGFEIIYYPLWKYDTSADVIWGEDSMPRYAEGIELFARYEMPEKRQLFGPAGIVLDVEFELYIPKLHFENRVPTPTEGSDIAVPKEGDWFQIIGGDQRFYLVNDVQEGDWQFGNPHSFVLTALPRQFSYQEAPETTTPEVTAVDEMERLLDELDDSDEIQEEADEHKFPDKPTDFWGNW